MIAAGGALGAASRWVVTEHMLTAGRFPWAVLAVNVAGSALAGAALVEARRRTDKESLLIDGAGTGFCGGFTTYSAFGLETARMLEAGDALLAAAFVAATLAAGLGAAAASITLLRHLSGGTPP